MQTVRILPDTCAWIDFFRGLQTPLCTALEMALREGSVVVCGVVMYELMQGIKVSGEEKAVVDAFRAVPFLEMTTECWLDAGRLAAELRKKGQTIPMSDTLIATLAVKHQATVLTEDNHFRSIPGLNLIIPQ